MCLYIFGFIYYINLCLLKYAVWKCYKLQCMSVNASEEMLTRNSYPDADPGATFLK